MHWDMTLHNNRSGNFCVNRWCNAFRILQGDQFYVDVRP